MSNTVPIRAVADRIGELPVPAESSPVIGHDQALDAFCALYAQNNLHHAWLLTGPKGIGKATFAFRLAGHLFRYPHSASAPDHYVPPQTGDTMESRVAGGGHPNILHLTRAFDDKTKKFKSELTVDVVRRTVGFFGTTTGEAGWRVCIVDSADELNRNAANALLKVLEEPPPRTLFLVLSHAPGRLLPTIRSRCLTRRMKPLASENILQLFDRWNEGLGNSDTYTRQDKERAAALSGGSVRKALSLLLHDGTGLVEKLDRIFAKPANPDWALIHALADELASRAKEEKYRLFLDLYYDQLAKQVALGLTDNSALSTLAYWSTLWEKTQQSTATTDAYNLDRKQMILSLFERMRHAA